MTVRTVLVGAVALTAGGLLAVGVAAHTSHTPSSLTVNAGLGYFYGSVTSPKEKCRPHRRVRVFRKRPGNDKLYGAEKSLGGMNLGSYTVEESTIPEVGTYYAEIEKRDLKSGSDRHNHICGGAKSNTVEVGP